MKFKHLCLCILALSFLAACSSRSKQPEMKIPTPESRLYTLKHKLLLTDEQMKAITPILEQDYKEKQELFSSFKKDDRDAMKEMHQKKEDLDWATTKALSRHLSKEQMTTYSKLLIEEEKKMQEQMSNGPGGGRPSRGGQRPGGHFTPDTQL